MLRAATLRLPQKQRRAMLLHQHDSVQPRRKASGDIPTGGLAVTQLQSTSHQPRSQSPLFLPTPLAMNTMPPSMTHLAHLASECLCRLCMQQTSMQRISPQGKVREESHSCTVSTLLQSLVPVSLLHQRCQGCGRQGPPLCLQLRERGEQGPCGQAFQQSLLHPCLQLGPLLCLLRGMARGWASPHHPHCFLAQQRSHPEQPGILWQGQALIWQTGGRREIRRAQLGCTAAGRCLLRQPRRKGRAVTGRATQASLPGLGPIAPHLHRGCTSSTGEAVPLAGTEHACMF